MDRDQLQRLIDQHYGCVRRMALALCGDPWEADEIAQDTFLAAIDAAQRFRGEGSESTWLYGISLRIYRSRVRSAIRRMRRGIAWFHRSGRGEAAYPSDHALDSLQWQQSLWATVARLPPAQREVVVLRFAEDMSLADIALAIRCPEGTVKSRLHHAMHKLRGWLSEDEVSSPSTADSLVLPSCPPAAITRSANP